MRHVSSMLWTLGLAFGAGMLAPGQAEGQVATAQASTPAIEARLARFNQFLNLSADQQAKLKPILEAEQQKLTDLSQQNGPRDHKIQALQAIGNDTEKRVRELLDPEQVKKFVASKSMLRPQLPAAALGS